MQCLNESCQKALDEEAVRAAGFVQCECGTKHAPVEQELTLVDDDVPLEEFLGG